MFYRSLFGAALLLLMLLSLCASAKSRRHRLPLPDDSEVRNKALISATIVDLVRKQELKDRVFRAILSN